MTQLVGRRPPKQKVTSLIPGQGTFLGCSFGPPLGHVQRQPGDVSLSHQCFSPSLSPSLPTSLKDYLFIFREAGMEVERKGGKRQCVVASRMPPTGDLARNPGVCPDWEWNW